MVWFHGGGFVTGSSASTFYGAGNLLDRDVVLVTANYRLGVLGFLTLGKSGEDVDVQGNQGLWDQVEGTFENLDNFFRSFCSGPFYALMKNFGSYKKNDQNDQSKIEMTDE